jgi:hypothetical protein
LFSSETRELIGTVGSVISWRKENGHASR